MNRPAPLVCIPGPTGTGKTEAAILVAEAVGGVVLNFDSRQVYRDLPIVTAQPSAEELARVPHRLYGFAALDWQVTAGEYARLLSAEAERARAEGLVPILVGGTGLYLRAFLQGLAEIPAIPPEVRRHIHDRCLAEGPAILHAELARIDPEYAAKISPSDRQRVSRALEVWQGTGRTMTDWHAAQAGRAERPAIKAGMTAGLDELVPRLEARIRAMLRAGAIDEVARAWEKCPIESAPGLSGIGCREILAYLRGEAGIEETVGVWLKNTRAYAKRQMTWFKKETATAWFGPGQAGQLARHVARALDEARTRHGKAS